MPSNTNRLNLIPRCLSFSPLTLTAFASGDPDCNNFKGSNPN
jgi:hypothetical protein